MILQKVTATIIVSLICASVSRADSILIDFDDLAEGVIVTDQYETFGVAISLVAGTTEGPITEYTGPLTYTDGNAVLAGSDVLGPLFDILIMFDKPLDYFSIIALNAEAFESFSLLASFAGVDVDAQFSTTELVDSEFGGPTVLAELGEIGSEKIFDTVLIDLTNGTGVPPGPEYWDNLEFNTSLDTDGDGDPDVTDPDDDNDGIGDGLDDDPLVANNYCFGVETYLFREWVVGNLTCAVSASIFVSGRSRVLAKGNLRLIAPIVSFSWPFSVAGSLVVISADPCPGCP